MAFPKRYNLLKWKLPEISYEGDIPNSEKRSIEAWTQAARENDMEYASNISLTNDKKQVKWKHFNGRTGYNLVNLFEGAALYGSVDWHPAQATSEVTKYLLSRLLLRF